MLSDVEYTLEATSPRRFTVFVVPKDGGRRVPVGEVHDSFGPTVGVVWTGSGIGKPVTFGNREDAASWVAMKASRSEGVFL